MKVCHLTSVHPRYDGRILQKECVSLASNGYDTTLLVNDDKGKERYRGVNIESISFKPKNRMERIVQAPRVLYRKALEVNADIYHLHDPELLSIALKLKRHGKKIIFDSHEDYVNRIKEKQWIPRILRPFFAKYYEAKEKKVLRKIDGVVSVTPHIVNRLKKINKNTVMITNYPQFAEKEIDYKSKSNSVCFAGGIVRTSMHENILKALAKLNGNVEYYLVGNTNSNYFEKLKTAEGFEYVHAFGLLSFEEVQKIYEKSLIGLALYDYMANTNGKEGTLGCIKLFEYMAAGMPIVCTDYDLWKDIVEKNNIGICVNPRNVNEICDAIHFLTTHREEAADMGRRGQKLARELYNWKSQEKILIDFYSHL